MIEIKNYGLIARQKRKDMGLSIQELADMVGVSRNTVSRFELGGNIMYQNYRLILDALGINDGDELCNASEAYPPNSMKRISAAIRAKRIYLSWPVETLAKKSGISASRIYAIESGANDAYMSTYLRLFTTLGIHLEFLDEDKYIDYKKSRSD